MRTVFYLTVGYFLRTPDNLNLFSISLEGSSYRESTVLQIATVQLGRSPKKFFIRPFGSQCGVKINGGGVGGWGAAPFPRSATVQPYKIMDANAVFTIFVPPVQHIFAQSKFQSIF